MKPTSDQPEWLSVSEAARELDMSPGRVRQLLRDGRLRGRNVGRKWAIPPDALYDFVQPRGESRMSRQSSRPTSKNKPLSVLSFFTGAMGLDLGLEKAGLETILACEFDKWSKQTIMRNRPNLPLLSDIWEHTADSVREAAGLTVSDEVDVVVGGPPCQAFSTAGRRKGFEDERGNVFLHFIDVALDIKPRYIVIENVRGLLSAALKHRPHNERGEGFPALDQDELPGGALQHIIRVLSDHGYSVSFNLYNAANFGAPQTRERVILICSRDGERVPYLVPTHSDDPSFGLPGWVSFREAVEDLDPDKHRNLEFPENRIRFYKMLGPGQYWKHLPEDLQREALGNSFHSGGGKTGFLRRLAWDKPSPTLVTHPAMPATDLAHPTELRPLSVQEYKRLQGFPDDWHIEGSLVQQYKQIGNAVPVPLGMAVGRQLIAHAAGAPDMAPENFRFSRYRNTSDLDLAPSESASLVLF